MLGLSPMKGLHGVQVHLGPSLANRGYRVPAREARVS